MQPNFQTLKKTWWWIDSPALFSRFSGDAWARSYELLRRLPKFKNEQFFYSNGGKTWLKLHPVRQQLFIKIYEGELERRGLIKRIFFSPKEIIFDCRLSSYSLIEALKRELNAPTPVFAGTASPALVPNGIEVEELPVKEYTKRNDWQPCRIPSLIRMFLPNVSLNGNRILSCFTTFVKDNPPKDFIEHRQRFSNTRPTRSPFNKPATLALALMDNDCCDIPKLTTWLNQSERWKIFGESVVPPRDAIMKNLHNARRQLQRFSLNQCSVTKAPNGQFIF